MDAILEQAGPLIFTDWRMWGDWQPYAFNFNGAAHPPLNEVSVVRDAVIAFAKQDHLLLYLVASSPEEVWGERLDEPLILLTFSTTNSAHSMCELLSFVHFYNALENKPDIGVSQLIADHLPFLYQLLGLLVPPNRIRWLRTDTRYRVTTLWMRRNRHMNAIANWADIPFTSDNGVMTFRDIDTRARFDDDPRPLNEAARRVALASRSPTPERVMLIKTVDDRSSTTPGRAMALPSGLRGQIEAAGIAVISVGDFADIGQYLATLYNARLLITSYGGAACTNRFFLNPECDVVLLGNRHYAFEYEYPSDYGEQWHLRHSHLFPVRRQRVLLDHNDTFDQAEVDRLLALCRC